MAKKKSKKKSNGTAVIIIILLIIIGVGYVVYHSVPALKEKVNNIIEKITGNNPTPHEHTYSDEYSYDKDYHFKKATCEHDDLFIDKASHEKEFVSESIDEENNLIIKNYKCKVCGYEWEEQKSTSGSSFDEMTIHFIAPSVDNAGDAIYIKAGDTDILIDAGPIQSSAADISAYVNNYCTDGKLEYVIATHADKDHIAGFVGTAKIPGIFEQYVCETIIDFPLSDKTTTLYANYQTKRAEEVAAGAKHYTALECYNNLNGASRVYNIANGITMEILYNYFYENHSSDENNYSVCVLFTQGERHYLFTGDLEEKGEEYLVEYNSLPEVDLFKAGHHGSPTSSNDCLLSIIKPKIVPVCACAGTDEYTKNKDNQFPSQAFISRIKNYTDKVYVLNQFDEETKFKPMNGNIVVSCNDEGINVNCSNNNTLLKDTDWCKANRIW